MPIAVVKRSCLSLMILKWKVPSTTGRSALAAVSVICTSFGPVALISCICAASVLAIEPTVGSLWRCSEYTTSALVSGLPSWNCHALAQLEGPDVASSFSNDSASAGCGVRLPSSVVRPL